MATTRAAVVLAHTTSPSGDHIFRIAFWIDTPANLVSLIPITINPPSGPITSSLASLVSDATVGEKAAITGGTVLEFVVDTDQVPDGVNANQLSNFLITMRNRLITAVNARSTQQANTKNNAVGKTLNIDGTWAQALTV